MIYALNGVDQPPEQWIDGTRSIDALGAVSFFDAQCALNHVRERNGIAFTPYGLDVLPTLGSACKSVQGRIDTERRRMQAIQPKFLRSVGASPTTSVGQLLTSLSPDTKVDALERLASLDDAERERLRVLPGQLANDPVKQAQELRTRARRVEALQSMIGDAKAALSDDAVAALRTLVGSYGAKMQAAEAAAKVSFTGDPLTKIGEDAWRELWEAARRYSAEAYPGESFPVVEPDDARCVLCQQLLADDAKDRLTRFERFVKDDTARQAAVAKQSLVNAVQTLDELRLRDRVGREQIADVQLVDAETATRARSTVARLLVRYRSLRKNLVAGVWKEEPQPAPDDIGGELGTMVAALTAEAETLEKAADQNERRRLQNELDELKAREWLATVLDDVKDHVGRLGELAKLEKCIAGTKTNAITAKSKALAKEHVTDRLRDAFASEIKRMHQGVRRLNVELTAVEGEYGSSFYRVQLVGAASAAIETVLSEGEHQCIALAGFLSELATEESQSAIVFDDPVTSLDHNWRECFARRLVEVGAERQVIVFTHDIVFLHDLMTGAGRDGVKISLCRVHTNRDHCGIVADGLPWIAQKTVQRIDELEKQTRDARDIYDAKNDDEYERRIGGIYSDLRATVERAIEEHVFHGVVLRHRDYINLGHLKSVTAVTTVDCERLQKLFQKCCDITQAHDRSALRSFGVPLPADALGDLVELRAVVDEIRARQKALA